MARAAVLATLLVALGLCYWWFAWESIEARGELVSEVAAEANSGTAQEVAQDGKVERLRARVLRSFPHDPEAYTQGLLWDRGFLFESTGRYGESSLRTWRPEDKGLQAKVHLPAGLFGEGLAQVGERLIQLTWRAELALVYDRESLARIDQWTYEGEGWGLCFDGDRLVMSDGSAFLTFRDAETFGVLERREVRLQGRVVGNLNELECAEGWIYANVYQTDEIVRVDPRDGKVTAVVDASGLLSSSERAQAEVLNGIAYEPDTETFFLTGKLWPRIFQVVFE